MHNNTKKNLAGLLLTGGKSKRMGYPKEALPIHNKKLEEHMLTLFYKIGIYDVYYSTNKNNFKHNYSVPTIQDSYNDKGPLNGIYSALNYLLKQRKQTTHLIILPIDMPLLTETLLSQLTEEIGNSDVCIFNKNNFPCCIAINKKIKDISKKLLNTNKTSITTFFNQLNLRKINSNCKKHFYNMNTPKKWTIANRNIKASDLILKKTIC